MSFAVVAAVKNEARYMREWIDFHRQEGAAHFFLFDNESDDELAEVIAPDVADGLVSRIEWGGVAQQEAIYRYALARTVSWFPWVAFIDVDEFMWAPAGGTVAGALARWPDAAAVRAHWSMFGPGGHVEPPDGSVIESYLYRAPEVNPHVKSIVRPERVRRYLDPHTFEVAGHTVEAPFDELRVNHYWTKSEDEARVKFARGRVDIGTPREWREFEDFAPATTLRDTALADRVTSGLESRA